MKTCADIVIFTIQRKNTENENNNGEAYYIPRLRSIILSSVNENRLIQDITESLTHESIHYVIHKRVNLKASIKWDDIISNKMYYDRDRDLFYGCYFKDGEIE